MSSLVSEKVQPNKRSSKCRRSSLFVKFVFFEALKDSSGVCCNIIFTRYDLVYNLFYQIIPSIFIIFLPVTSFSLVNTKILYTTSYICPSAENTCIFLCFRAFPLKDHGVNKIPTYQNQTLFYPVYITGQ